MDSLLFNSPQYIQLRKDVDLLKQLASSNVVISEEGFLGVTHKVVFNILDRINKHVLDIINSVLSSINIDGIFDKLVYNSPLEDFDKKRGFMMMAAFKNNLPGYNTVNVPKPRGMKCTYEQALATNKKIFELLNMEITVKLIDGSIKALGDIINSNTSTKDTLTEFVNKMLLEVNVILKGIETLSKEHDKDFSGDPHKDIKTPFSKEFSNSTTFSKLIEETKKQFKYLIKVASIRDTIKLQSANLRKLMELLQKKPDIISTDNMKSLINYLDFISAAYQLYGSVCLTHIALETNLVHVVEDILTIYEQHLVG